MAVGKKIEELIASRNRNVNDVAASIGISPSTLYSIIRRDNNKVEIDLLQNIADELSVTLDYFSSVATAKSDYLSTKEQTVIKKYRALDEHGKKVVDVLIHEETARMEKEKISSAQNAEDNKVIKLLEPLQAASAGYGEFADDETADTVTIKYNSLTSKADYIMRVAGDSMEPKFYDGQRVLVRQQPAVELGEIGIFIKEGSRFIKIYRGDHMESANPKYKDEPFEEYSRCVGKVLGILEEDWIVE